MREPVVAKRWARKPADAHTERLASDGPLRRFTLDEYHHLIEIGFFQPEERLELIEGTLLYMSPISPRHAAVISKLINLFVDCLGGEAQIRAQSPISLPSKESEPEPDFALVLPDADFYSNGHPESADVLLVAEVAQSSLRYDREVKIPLYAAAGIREYWIVNLNDDVVEVYRQPTVLASGAAGYAEKLIFAGSEQVAPQAFPDCVVAVNAIIPGAN